MSEVFVGATPRRESTQNARKSQHRMPTATTIMLAITLFDNVRYFTVNV